MRAAASPVRRLPGSPAVKAPDRVAGGFSRREARATRRRRPRASCGGPRCRRAPWPQARRSKSPSPDPPRPRASSARLKRSNARAANASGNPAPESRTWSSTVPSALAAESTTYAAPVGQGVVDEVHERLPDAHGVDVDLEAARSARRARPAPSSAAREPKRRLDVDAEARRRAIGSRRTGSVPRSARAMKSRSSASRESRCVSSAAERSASSSSSRERGRRSARSSSVRSSASGVRSSWLASATNRRSCSKASWRRASMSLSVVASRATSSRAVGTGRLFSSPGVTASARRGGGASTGRKRRRREGSRRGTPRAGRAGGRSRAVGGDGRATRRAVRATARRRRTRRRSARLNASTRQLPGRPETCSSSQTWSPEPARHATRRRERRSPAAGEALSRPVESKRLGECRAAACVRVDTCRVIDLLARLRDERLVDRAEELASDPLVHEEPDRCENDGHRDRETEREANADRKPRHVLSLRAAGSRRRGPSRSSRGRTAGRPSRGDSDVDVDDVGAALEGYVPRAVEQLRSRERDPGPAHEQLEEGELLRGEIELRSPAPRPMRGGIEAQVADLDDGRALDRRAPREGAEPGEELLEREWLRRGSRPRRRPGRRRGRRPRRARSA